MINGIPENEDAVSVSQKEAASQPSDAANAGLQQAVHN